MANPTTCGIGTDWEPILLETSTSPASVTIDPDKQYEIWHTGLNASGTATTDAVMVATEDSTAALTAGTGQCTLINGMSPIRIGPGISTIKFDATANAPVIAMAPVEYNRGHY